MKHAHASALVLAASAALTARALPLRDRSSGVSCQAKYSGIMRMTNLGSGYGATSGYTNVSVVLDGNDPYTLATATSDLIKFQFDECTTDGWNIQGKEFGQLKAVEYAEQDLCVTASGDGGSTTTGIRHYPLQLSPCGSFNGGILHQQWYYADYIAPSSALPYVSLELTGNPNDNNETYSVPYVASEGSGAGVPIDAQVLNTPVPNNLVLYNVEILS